jgi:chorismate lyase/3-hydroxybenzoate synthase
VSRPQPFAGGATPPPALDFGYAAADTLARQLADPQVLAVFGFGDAAPAHDDPRWLRIRLQPLQAAPAPIEVWRSASPVRCGRDGDVAWSTDGRLLFGALEIDEGEDGIEIAAARAYARMAAFVAASDTPHLLRIWNYMDAITHGEGDEERYRRFCVGRAVGMDALDTTRLPAATAIGRRDGVRRLQLYWLAAHEPGLPLENPRQVSAYRYPRQYGPQSPSFARALLPPAGAAMPLLLSGTAAIVGHASQHSGEVRAQVDETLANLDSLVATARHQGAMLPATLGDGSLLKVYVRDAEDAQAVAARLDERLDPAVPRLLLHAQVCRRELLVEIDGVHGPASA